MSLSKAFLVEEGIPSHGLQNGVIHIGTVPQGWYREREVNVPSGNILLIPADQEPYTSKGSFYWVRPESLPIERFEVDEDIIDFCNRHELCCHCHLPLTKYRTEFGGDGFHPDCLSEIMREHNLTQWEIEQRKAEQRGDRI